MLCSVMTQVQHPLSQEYGWGSVVMSAVTVVTPEEGNRAQSCIKQKVHKQQDPSESHEEAGDAEAAASRWDLVPGPHASAASERPLTPQFCLVI